MEKRNAWCAENLKQYIKDFDKCRVVNDLLTEARLGGTVRNFFSSDITAYSTIVSPDNFILDDLLTTFVNLLKEIDTDLTVNIKNDREYGGYVEVSWDIGDT
jgi:hypothetical protein